MYRDKHDREAVKLVSAVVMVLIAIIYLLIPDFRWFAIMSIVGASLLCFVSWQLREWKVFMWVILVAHLMSVRDAYILRPTVGLDIIPWWTFLFPSAFILVVIIDQAVYQRKPPKIEQIFIPEDIDWRFIPQYFHRRLPFCQCTCPADHRMVYGKIVETERSFAERTRSNRQAKRFTLEGVFYCEACTWSKKKFVEID